MCTIHASLTYQQAMQKVIIYSQSFGESDSVIAEPSSNVNGPSHIRGYTTGLLEKTKVQQVMQRLAKCF